jgi:plasmid stability protein
MPQLLVRDIETAVLKQLRRSAAAQGVSVEEAHRRLLRASLVGGSLGPKQDFLDYLRSIPQGAEVNFPRSRHLPREIVL